MANSRYKMAGKVVEIHAMHDDVHRLCADYATDD